MRCIKTIIFTIGVFCLENASAGSLSFASNTYSVNENTATLTITVNRTGSTASAASVTVVSVNATATAGLDFTAVSQVLNWGAGDGVAKTFTVAIIDDSIVEGLEAFTLKFTSPVGDGTGGDAIVSLADYEEGKIQFDSAYFSGNEDSLTLIARLNRVSGADGIASVKLKSESGTPPASNTSDYTDVDTTINNKPKYIGFLEYLYIPEVISLLTFLKFIGSIVVLDFTNLETGIIKMKIPIKSIRIENKV